METSSNDRRDERPVDINSVDSELNTSDARDANSRESLTPDESRKTDPNEVEDKPSFTPSYKDQNDRTRFDGNINI